MLETYLLAGCEILEKVLAFVVNLALGPRFLDLARCHHQNELNIYFPGAIPASVSQNLGWVGPDEDSGKPRNQNLIRVQVILTSGQVAGTLGIKMSPRVSKEGREKDMFKLWQKLGEERRDRRLCLV